MNLDEMAKAEAFDELYKAIVGLERSTEKVGVKVLRDCIWLRYTEVLGQRDAALSERDAAIGERDDARAALRGIAKRMESIRQTMDALYEDAVDAASPQAVDSCDSEATQ